MSSRHYDIAIVGGGLAGTCMAFAAMQQGKTILLIDTETLSSSSRIAAGIYNPVVFKRTTLAWRAESMLASCLDFYRRIETTVQTRFHYPVVFNRFFSGYEEQNEWVSRSGQEMYRPFLSEAVMAAAPPFVSPYGMSVVQAAGWVDTRVYLRVMREQLERNNGLWLQQEFDPVKLQRTETGFVYDTTSFDRIVFCEGHLVAKNPWFGFIPLFPVKGEVLDLETETLPGNHVYNGAAYMLVKPDGKVKLGSTYDWQHLNDEPTETGRQELLEKLEGFYKGKKTVLGHAAGVRPSARDRRPVIGEHPTEKNMYVLNGLGAKGVSLGPWCAQMLYACMYKGKIPDREVSVSRFVK